MTEKGLNAKGRLTLMDTDESRESTMPEAKKNIEKLPTVVADGAIPPGVLNDLQTMFEPAEGTPENLLVTSAQRLHNVAHSLMESRETAYLDSEEHYPVLGPETVDSIVRLSTEARACLRDALEFKKAKIQAVVKLRQAARGK